MIEIDWNILVALSVVVGLVALLGTRAALSRLKPMAEQFTQLVNSLEAEKARSEGLERKLDAMREWLAGHAERIETLQDRVERMEIQPDGRAYDEAISMVERGASQDSLVSSFGLSEGEADLVTRIHRRRPAS